MARPQYGKDHIDKARRDFLKNAGAGCCNNIPGGWHNIIGLSNGPAHAHPISPPVLRCAGVF